MKFDICYFNNYIKHRLYNLIVLNKYMIVLGIIVETSYFYLSLILIRIMLNYVNR